MSKESVNSDAKSADGSESADKDRLSKLLASWDDDKSEKKAGLKNDGLATELAHLKYRIEMKDIIPAVKGDLAVPDKFVETYINSKADQDQKLMKLWDERDTRRSEFDAAIKALSGDFVEFCKASGIKVGEKVDVKDEKDDKGLAAAARMARETQSKSSSMDDLNWGAMSDTEFALKKREVIRMAESGKFKAA